MYPSNKCILACLKHNNKYINNYTPIPTCKISGKIDIPAKYLTKGSNWINIKHETTEEGMAGLLAAKVTKYN